MKEDEQGIKIRKDHIRFPGSFLPAHGMSVANTGNPQREFTAGVAIVSEDNRAEMFIFLINF